MIVDRHGRQFRNLRVSLTAACNYACTYCVPDGKRLLPAREELHGEHLAALIRLLVDTAGIEKIRLTGGEPLLSKKFDELLAEVMALGLDDVSLTTNGQLLPRKAHTIIDSGMRRINISLDTLDAARFRAIARSGDLETVLHGMDLMRQAGLRVKVNMVPMRGVNDDQILPLLAYCLERDIELRFIELMSMGHLQDDPKFDAQFIGLAEIVDLISGRHNVSLARAPRDSTAVRYHADDGFFGVIANESQPFCRTCTRLRLSSNGRLYGCLSNARSYDLRPLLDMGYDRALIELQHMLGRALADKQDLSFRGETTVMKFIGG